MRQFDIIDNPSARSRPVAPYVMVIQSHFFDEGPTILVAPLMRMSREAVLTRVSLAVDFAGAPLILMLSEIGAIDRRPAAHAVGSLIRYEDDIRRALDRLFTGF